MTPKQKAFADFYIQTGNATEAAIRAGYSKNAAAVIGCENLIKPNIKNYIDVANEQITGERIADTREAKQLWTSIMRNEAAECKDRLRASELLAKSYGAFINRVEHSGDIDAEVIITIGGKEYGEI